METAKHFEEYLDTLYVCIQLLFSSFILSNLFAGQKDNVKMPSKVAGCLMQMDVLLKRIFRVIKH